MRAPGWPQGCFALELAIDELARKLKIDRLEFRRRNNSDPVRAMEYDLGARAFEWDEKARAARITRTAAARRGRGCRRMARDRRVRSAGAGDRLSRRAREIRIGTQDLGTGTRTILAMVAAEELGLPLDRVTAEIGDTRYRISVAVRRQHDGAFDHSGGASGGGSSEE